MQPVYQNPDLPTTESVYRTNTVIWSSMFLSQLVFLLVLYFIKPQVFGLGVGENSGFDKTGSNSLNPMIIILAVLGLSAFVLSFAIKARLMKFATQNSNLNLVNSAQIIAYALCEAISLFGLLAALAFDSHYFWVWFVVGILALALHFPRRGSFQAAAFKGIT